MSDAPDQAQALPAGAGAEFASVSVDLSDSMARVETRLAEIARSDGATTAAIIAYTGATRGKRLRARLAFVCAEAFGDPGREEGHVPAGGTADALLVDLAAAVELVHLASLLHDDLVDGSDTRRGMPTVARAWGAASAVLAGDFLFAAAFRMLVGNGQYHALAALAGALRAMSEAEIEQLALLWDLSATEESYWRCVRGKTGSLFAAACEAGAAAGGAGPQECTVAHEFGMTLGCAFQAVDDLLDLIGDPARLGKPVGQDLGRGLLTLPVIRLLAAAGDRRVAELKRLLSERRSGEKAFQLARELVRSAGAADYARERISGLIDRANTCLAALPPRRRPLAMAILSPLSEAIATRDR